MVPDYAENSLVVVSSLLRIELDDDPCRRMRSNGSLCLRKGKDIGLVAEELESGGLITIIHNVQQTIRG